MNEEYAFTCPYCWETITMLLDLSVAEQEFIEDCEVCCNPIAVAYAVNDAGEVVRFAAEQAQ